MLSNPSSFPSQTPAAVSLKQPIRGDSNYTSSYLEKELVSIRNKSYEEEHLPETEPRNPIASRIPPGHHGHTRTYQGSSGSQCISKLLRDPPAYLNSTQPNLTKVGFDDGSQREQDLLRTTNFHQSRSKSSPPNHMSASLRQRARQDPDKSVASVDRTLPHLNASGNSHAIVNQHTDQSLGNRRSVQVTHPENRALFDLTTISNEGDRDKLTTVQTTIIPFSNPSQRQNHQAGEPYEAGRSTRRGASEQQPRIYESSLPPSRPVDLAAYRSDYAQREQALQLAKEHERAREQVREKVQEQALERERAREREQQQNGSRERSNLDDGKRRISPLRAFQKIVVSQARKNLGIEQDEHCRTYPLPLLTVNEAQHQANDQAQLCHTQRTYQNAPASSTGVLKERNIPTQFYYTAEQERLNSMVFENVTPGHYEETVPSRNNAYTYSMYTETANLRSDNYSSKRINQTRARGTSQEASQKQLSGSGSQAIQQQTYDFSKKDSVALDSQYNSNYVLPGGNPPDMDREYSSQRELVEKPPLAVPRDIHQQTQPISVQSPEREIFREGYETAIFPKNQLQNLTCMKGTRHVASIENEHLQHAKLTDDVVRNDRKHVHSDSIMSAQFQADGLNMLFANQERHRTSSQNDRATPQMMFTQRAPTDSQKIYESKAQPEMRRATSRQHDLPSGNDLMSGKSADRKTFTLGERGIAGMLSGPQIAMTKAELQSLQQNFLTSPTEQNAPQSTLQAQANGVSSNLNLQPHSNQLPLQAPIQSLQQPTQQATSHDPRQIPHTIASSSQRQQFSSQTRQQTTPHNLINIQDASQSEIQDFQTQMNRTEGHLNDTAPPVTPSTTQQANHLHSGPRGTSQFQLSQPYHAPDNLGSHMMTLDNFPQNMASSQMQISLKPQQFPTIHSHRPTSDPFHKAKLGQSLAAGLSDPSITVQQAPVNMLSHQNLRHEPLEEQVLQQIPHNRTVNNLQSPNRHNLLPPQQQCLNTQRLPNQHELSLDEMTPLSQKYWNLPHQSNIQLSLNTQSHPQTQPQAQLPPHVHSQQQQASQPGSVSTSHAQAQSQAAIYKQEMMLLRKQVNDARASQLFLKKQTLTLQHTINMQNIQITQLQENMGHREFAKEEEQTKAEHLEAKYEEQKRLCDDLIRRQEETEQLYKQRLQMTNEELDHVRQQKAAEAYKVHGTASQLVAGLRHLAETVGDDSYLAPFLSHFGKICETLQLQVGSLLFNSNTTAEEDRSTTESRQQVKMLKRAQNFERFRKEIKNLVRNHYRAKLHERDIELEKALSHIKAQDKQIRRLSDTCEQLRLQVEKAQASVIQLNGDKQHMQQTFDEERLRLERLHLQEVTRLHKAVKGMKKKAIQFEIQRTETPVGLTKSSLEMETRQTESEMLTTLDNAALLQHPSKRHSALEEKQLLVLQNEQFRQTLEGQNVLILELQKALQHKKELHRYESGGNDLYQVTTISCEDQNPQADQEGGEGSPAVQRSSHQSYLYRAQESQNYAASSDYIQVDQMQIGASGEHNGALMPVAQVSEPEINAHEFMHYGSGHVTTGPVSVHVSGRNEQGDKYTNSSQLFLKQFASATTLDKELQKNPSEQQTQGKHHPSLNDLNFRDLQFISNDISAARQETHNSVQATNEKLTSESGHMIRLQPDSSRVPIATDCSSKATATTVPARIPSSF